MTRRARSPLTILAILLSLVLVACGDLAGAANGSSSSPSAKASASASGSASPSASPSQTETPEDRVSTEDNHNGDCCKKNVVQILNKTPGRLKMVSSVQLNRIRGDVVTPLNAAIAVGQDCTGCQTIAVALQLDLYVQGAHNVSPENYAIALNVRCTQCVTIAHAIQFALPVSDPEDDNNDGQDAKDAKKLLRDMQKELDAIAKDRNITVDQAEQRVEVVLQQFRNLGNSMRQDLKRTTDENSPSASPSRSPSATPSSSTPPSATASPSRTP
jgi:hypothetical protein